MDKGLTEAKWVLIIRPNILQMPHNLSAQFVCPSPKVLDALDVRSAWTEQWPKKSGKNELTHSCQQVSKEQRILTFFTFQTPCCV